MNIEHVALQVSDPVAMADWYVRHLGCSVARAGESPGFVRFLKDGGGRSMLELYSNPAVPVPDYASLDPLLLHVAFLSETPAADRDRLLTAGATIAQDLVTSPAGDQLVMLRDPWGLALQLVRRASPILA